MRKLSWVEVQAQQISFWNKQHNFQITSSFRSKRNKFSFLCTKRLFVVSKPSKGKKSKWQQTLKREYTKCNKSFLVFIQKTPFGLLIVWFTAISSFSYTRVSWWHEKTLEFRSGSEEIMSPNLKSHHSLTWMCGDPRRWTSSALSREYLWLVADCMESTASRQRFMASPGGALDGDITWELMRSNSLWNCDEKWRRKKKKKHETFVAHHSLLEWKLSCERVHTIKHRLCA